MGQEKKTPHNPLSPYNWAHTFTSFWFLTLISLQLDATKELQGITKTQYIKTAISKLIESSPNNLTRFI